MSFPADHSFDVQRSGISGRAMTKRFKGRAVAIGLAAMLPAALFAQANDPGQDLESSTPPELRDFRLDQPPPGPGPEQVPSQPTPQPILVEPPPAVPTTEAPPSRDPVAITRTKAAPSSDTRPRGARAPTAAQDNAARLETSPALPSVNETANANPGEPISAPDMAPTSAEPAASPSTVPALDDQWLAWAFGAAALLAAMFAAVFVWGRRRQSDSPEEQAFDFDQLVPTIQPSPPARLDRSKPAEPKALRPTAQEHAARPTLSVTFQPTAAQLSIASLTITGKLTVENCGNGPATGLALRSQMISAQDGQKEAIEAFHSNLGDGEIQPLGEMAAGERIDAIIEIRLPRAELHAFRWTEREFVAPIVLINVAGQIGKQPVEGRLSQLIGREGEMSSPRMKPLAIDRGPKRYTGVSARPVFA
jgi:hypothetical protein